MPESAVEFFYDRSLKRFVVACGHIKNDGFWYCEAAFLFVEVIIAY